MPRISGTMPVRLAAGLVVGAVLVAACANGDDESPAATNETPATTTEQAAEDQAQTSTEPVGDVEDGNDAPAAVSGLEGAIGEASDLVLGWFNGAPFDEATYDAAFDDAFRGQVPFEQMTPLLDQLRLEGPFEVREVQRSTTTEAELIVVGASGERALLAIAIASADDPTMSGLFIAPAAEPSFDPPTSTDDAVTRLEALGTTRLGAFDADCSPIDGGPNLLPDDQAPIGSGFKLWVLAAVVGAVDDGSITWDDEVEIRDELDSIPSGTTQNDEPGTTQTVRELAKRMIETSDNTATDHLIDLVGRDRVEQALSTTGHQTPNGTGRS